MGFVQIFRMDEKGASWVDLSQATPEEKLDLEIALELAGSPVTRLIMK